MDSFFVDFALAVLFRVLRNRKQATAFYGAFAKLYVALRTLEAADPAFLAAVKARDEQR